jgi:hypothetical protein
MDVTILSPEKTFADGNASTIKNVLEKHSSDEIADASGKPAVEAGTVQ